MLEESTINIYKTYNAADIFALQKYLTSTLYSLHSFGSGKPEIRFNYNGTWHANIDLSIADLIPKAFLIKDAKSAFAATKKWTQQFDEKLSSRVSSRNDLPKRLFDADMVAVSALPIFKEIYGQKIAFQWKCRYRIMVKPSKYEKAVAADNAEILLTCGANGLLSAIEFGFLPIKERVSYPKQTPTSIPSSESEIPATFSIGYELQFENAVIIPYYFIIEKREKKSSML